MLVAGASLLVAAAVGRASPGTSRQGGTLLVDLPIYDIDDIDPSIAYGTASWHIEYSTALKLFNYPDAAAPRGSRLIPEGATGYTVSNGGRTYTFTIRKGFRFSNGAPVRARNYAFAINRSFGRDLQSPGFHFVADEHATNIVGAQAVRDGYWETARGVRVRGNKLSITLARPDPTLLAKLSMPFFQAMPRSLSRTNRVINVDAGHPLPSAGPYYVSERVPNRLVVLRRNPYYAKRVARTYERRPANLARTEIRTAVNLQESYEAVRAGRDDYTYDLPPNLGGDLAAEFGLHGRFRIRPSNCISYIALNSGGTGAGAALFRNNPQLRRAVNYVIDRQAMADLSGAYAVLPHDQYLPRGFPGFRDLDAYPFRPDEAKARELARGHVPSGGPWIYYISIHSPGPERAELVRRQLAKIGITVEPRGFRGYIGDPAARRSSPHALASEGWCQDYSDPYDFINTLLYGGSIQEENNKNVAHFNNRAYDQRMEHAARLSGDARLRAYARLEHDLVTKAAPWAVWGQPTNEFLFGNRVEMRSFVYQPIYEAPPYNVLALK